MASVTRLVFHLEVWDPGYHAIVPATSPLTGVWIDCEGDHMRGANPW